MTADQDSQAQRPNPRRKAPVQKLTAKTIATHRKQDAAVELKAAGRTNQQIADQLGYADRSSVSKAVSAALSRAGQLGVDELRAVQDVQLGVAMQVVFEVLNRVFPQVVIPKGMDAGEGRVWVEKVADAVEGRQELRLKAVDRLVRISDRAGKLHGLDAPIKTEVSGDGSISVLFSAALAPVVRPELEA